jgi:hypothetical protein
MHGLLGALSARGALSRRRESQRLNSPGHGWRRKGCGSSASGTASQNPEVSQYRKACGARADRSGRTEGRQSGSGSGDGGRSCSRLAGARLAPPAGARIGWAVAVRPGAQPRCSFPYGYCVRASASRRRCSPDRRSTSGPAGGERSPRSPGSPAAFRRRRVLESSAAGTRRDSRMQRPGSTVAPSRRVGIGAGHGGVHRDGGIQR